MLYGPGGCDSSHWQNILLRYGSHSRLLCDSIAGLTRSLSNSLVDWSHIQALLANRLIALDKSPGVRPIGIGESLRRLIGKVICFLTRDDAEAVCGVSQLCAGLRCGAEGAIHVAGDLFEAGGDSHGMLVMDAENAFNSINRTALLWNIRILWPRVSRFVFNTYRGWSPLIIKGHDVGLYSSEGVIQGDPLSMFLYALATLPLINQLQSDPSITQLWYGDDSSAVGCFSSLLLWYENLCLIDPLFGYTPAPTKSHLVVKESMIDTASSLFANTGINIVTSCRFLGGVIGDQSGKMSFVSNKVDEWSRYVDLLSSVAEDQPQAAFIGFTKSLQQEWLYLQRVIADCEQQFHDLESTIKHKFIPSLIGHDCDDTNWLLFSLPINMGGLNIRIPTSSTTIVYNSSRAATQILTDSIKNSISFSVTDHITYSAKFSRAVYFANSS